MPGDSWIIFFQESKDYSRIGCLERFWHIMIFRVLLPNIPKAWSILPQRQGTTICSPVLRVGLRGQALYSYFWFEENGPKIFLEATEKGDKDFTGKGLEDGFSWASSTWQAKSITTNICSQKPIETWNSSKIPKKGGSKRVSQFHYQDSSFQLYNEMLEENNHIVILSYGHIS